MIKYVYTTKNKKSGNFNIPMLQDFQKDAAAEVYTISAKEANLEAVKELELYYLGTYDTKTGEFVNDKEFILDLGTIADGSSKEN